MRRRLVGRHAVESSGKDNDRDVETLEVLLMRQAPVGRDEHVEPCVARQLQKFAVALRGPPPLGSRFNLMAWKEAFERARRGLIKQNPN
jgi:hypothetical protein